MMSKIFVHATEGLFALYELQISGQSNGAIKLMIFENRKRKKGSKF